MYLLPRALPEMFRRTAAGSHVRLFQSSEQHQTEDGQTSNIAYSVYFVLRVFYDVAIALISHVCLSSPNKFRLICRM